MSFDNDLLVGQAPPPLRSYPPHMIAPVLVVGYARTCQWVTGQDGLLRTMCGAPSARASWCQAHAKRIFVSAHKVDAVVAKMEKYAGITPRR